MASALDDTIAAGDEQVAAAPAADPARALLGGRYEILGLLGAGGMGNVYRARDHELDEVVALKLLRPEVVGTPGAIERFRREVKLARRITHPNVARVFDIGEHGGERMLTMELIDGESLAALLSREGRLAPARALDIASALCAGLGAAHDAGVIHLDLKADNVLIERGERVVITDFGIARAAARDDAAQSAGFVGTPAYMAPEQVEGSAVDARADLYALGCVLYEMLTGARPWEGETVFAVAAARLMRPPPDPRARRPDLPHALAEVIVRCMARHPVDRFASAAEVAAALAAVTPAPITSLPPPRAAIRPAARKSVAVLPFRNAGEREHDYVADGLTEDVIDVLSMAPGLRVCSRGVVMRFRGVDRDPRDLGRELDVSAVVEGTVRRAGGEVRVSARVISVGDGVQIWARRFTRSEAELLGVSDDVAHAVAGALTSEIDGPARPAAADPEAMDLYLRARAAYHRYFEDPSGRGHLALFERAVALAPDNPRILAGYAMARARVWSTDPAARAAAEDAAARAVASAPELPETQLALATVRLERGEPNGAVSALRRLLQKVPLHAEAHDLLGRVLSETMLTEDARRHLVTALSLDPPDILGKLMLVRLHELCGRPEEADRLLASGGAAALPGLGRILMWRRDAARATEVLATVRDDTGAAPVIRAFLHAAAGAPPDYSFLEMLSDQVRSTLRQRVFFLQLQVEVAAASGDLGRALDTLEAVVPTPCFDILWMDRCRLFDAIRAEPRFIAARGPIAERAARVEEAYLAAS